MFWIAIDGPIGPGLTGTNDANCLRLLEENHPRSPRPRHRTGRVPDVGDDGRRVPPTARTIRPRWPYLHAGSIPVGELPTQPDPDREESYKAPHAADLL